MYFFFTVVNSERTWILESNRYLMHLGSIHLEASMCHLRNRVIGKNNEIWKIFQRDSYISSLADSLSQDYSNRKEADLFLRFSSLYLFKLEQGK